jgi:HK97 family phage portal protein
MIGAVRTVAQAAIRPWTPAPPARPGVRDTGGLWGLTGGAAWSDVSSVSWPVTAAEALAVPSVRRGVQLLCGLVAQCPLRAWDGQRLLPDTSEPARLLVQPEPHRSLYETLSLTVQDLVLHGRAYWRVLDRYDSGYPRAVEYLPAEWVTEDLSDHPWAVRVTRGDWPTVGSLGAETVRLADMVTMRTADQGLLALGARTIRTAIALEESAQTYARHEVPTGYLRNTNGTDLPEDEVLALLRAWESARRVRTTGYLNQSVEYQPLSGPDPERLQLTEARQYVAAEIARLLNLPPRYVGASAGDSMHYSSLTMDRRDLVDTSARPLIGAIEGPLSLTPSRTDPRICTVVPSGVSVRVDLRGFLLGDPQDRAEVWARLVPLGVLTADEVRAADPLLLGLVP